MIVTMLASKILSKNPEEGKGNHSRHRLREGIHLMPKAANGRHGMSTKKILMGYSTVNIEYFLIQYFFFFGGGN